MKPLSLNQIAYARGYLVKLMASRGKTAAQLAEDSGVAQSTLSKILSHEAYTPSFDTLEKIFVGGFGVAIADVLRGCAELQTRKLLGYIGTPLTGLSDAQDAEVTMVVLHIRELADDDSATPGFHLYWPGEKTHPKKHPDSTPQEVYLTDRSRASTHDFMIMFCGAPSYGVGQENEIATQAGVPTIRLVPQRISRMISGSFLDAIDIEYTGSLESRVRFDKGEFLAGLKQIREKHFRLNSMHRSLSSGGFGDRLRRLIDDRASDNEQFAGDIGVSLNYVLVLTKESIAISNPSLRILQRMSHRLGVSVSFLIGETNESDPTWVASMASFRQWVDSTANLDARIVFRVRDKWQDSFQWKRHEGPTTTSHVEPELTMKVTDWDKSYAEEKKVIASGPGKLF